MFFFVELFVRFHRLITFFSLNHVFIFSQRVYFFSKKKMFFEKRKELGEKLCFQKHSTENPEGVCSKWTLMNVPMNIPTNVWKKSSFMNFCNHSWMDCKHSWMFQNFGSPYRSLLNKEQVKKTKWTKIFFEHSCECSWEHSWTFIYCKLLLNSQ